MKTTHQQEKEQFKRLFEDEQIDNINDRLDILDEFLKTEKHITYNEFNDLLKKTGRNYAPEFVRDTIRLMCKYGFAQENLFIKDHECDETDYKPDKIILYEHRHLGEHHDHMICIKCGSITEFENNELERMQTMITSQYGFYMLQHKMVIYGICSDCLKKRDKCMPLIMAKPGERMIIKDFSGGSNAKMRFMSMGLRQGDRLEVIGNTGQSQVIIAVDCKRYALGKGMAQKILVSSEQLLDSTTCKEYTEPKAS